jgi:hypothetical protein
LDVNEFSLAVPIEFDAVLVEEGVLGFLLLFIGSKIL